MHSSRMRTGRSLTVCRRGGSPCQGGLFARGVSLLGGFLPGGLPARGVLRTRGVSLPGGSPCWGGSPCQGGLLARGGSPCRGGLLARWDLPAGGVLPAGDPPVDRITDTSKNITLATTSLRPVKGVHFRSV